MNEVDKLIEISKRGLRRQRTTGVRRSLIRTGKGLQFIDITVKDPFPGIKMIVSSFYRRIGTKNWNFDAMVTSVYNQNTLRRLES